MVERARLLGSEGKGLGQQTGGNASTDAKEARSILNMISNCRYHHIRETVGSKGADFVSIQIDLMNTNPQFTVTGKQLFWLRDIKDKLVDAGLI